MRREKRRFVRFLTAILTILPSAVLFTSCFTGIEGTKTVTLSKSDKSLIERDAEEKVMEKVVSEKLGKWLPGKKFLVTDSKIAYVLEGSPSSPLDFGTILTYKESEKKITPSGEENTSIVFDSGGNKLKYQVRKPLGNALETFLSSQLPMLLDLDMVKEAGSVLVGNEYWIKTDLWYDEKDAYKKGRKFSKVKITSVAPGNESFPLKVTFSDEDSQTAYILMNFGNSGNESRSFSHLFSLKDIRNGYPNISDEVWELIRQSKVAAGMTKEECKLALGNPSDVNQGHDYSRTLEIWQYPDGSYLQFADGILVNFRK